MKRHVIIYLVQLLLVSGLTARQEVRIVEVIGLKRTNAAFVGRFLQLVPGAELDSVVLEADVQSLRNLRLFSDVTFIVEQSEQGLKVQYLVRENLSLLPISNFGRIDDGFWFQAGAVDYNWLGRGNTLGGYYRYYDRNSFEAYLSSPYLLGRSWGLDANLNLFATSEPTFFDDGQVVYDVDRWAAIMLLRHEFSRRRMVQFGGGYLTEEYSKQVPDPANPGPGPASAAFDKYLLKVVLTDRRVDYYSYQLDGRINELLLETIKTGSESGIFWKIEDIFRYYQRLWGGGNAAVRVRLGIASNDATPFAPFVLDSYLTVRGAGNRVARGTAEATTNLELRQALLENGWMAIQGVAFADVSAWRPGGAPLNRLLRKENIVSFVGGGARLYLKRLHHLVLRIDYGVSVSESRQNGIVIGLGQYF